MALNLPKWIIAAAIGCGAIWLGLFRQNHSATVSGSGADAPRVALSAVSATRATAAATSNAVGNAVERLRLLQIRDSVVKAAPPATSPALTVMISAEYGAETSRRIDSLVRDKWSRLDVGKAKVPVVIAAVFDSSTTLSGVPRRKLSVFLPVTVFLPSAETGSRCVSIIRVPMPINDRAPRYLQRNLVSPQTIGTLLGPCLYYATFGNPGPQVGQWLRDGGWRFADNADWSTAPPRWTWPTDVWVSSPFFEKLTSTSDVSWRLRSVLARVGVECLGGERGRCADAALSLRTLPGDSTWRSNVVSSNGTNERAFYFPSAPTNLGPYDGWLLSEMTRSLGKERFETFWRSPAPVPEAFSAAAGQSIDDWIRDWGIRIYGAIPTGPGIPPIALWSGALALALGLMSAIAIARRRRVG